MAAFAGLFLGLSLISHPSNIVIIPGFLAYYIFSIRHDDNKKILLLSFLVVLGSVLLLPGYTNYVRFGSFTDFGYEDKGETLSSHAGWHGLVGLLVSPGRGIIPYFPIAILLPVAFRYMYTKDRGISFICIYTFVAFWLFFGTIHITFTKFGPAESIPESETWSGGTWGPRYLIPVLPFLVLTCGTLAEHLKGNNLKVAAIAILSAAGFLINLSAVLVWYPFGWIGFGGSEVMTWSLYSSFIIKHIDALIFNYASQIQPVRFSLWSFSLAPCAFDNYLFCEFGPTSILVSLPVIGVLGVIIVNEIRHGHDARKLSVKRLP